jgi:hypothetical protein
VRLIGRLWPTLRDPPAGAEAVSHISMVRAGLAPQLASGLYTLLPFGLRTIRRAEAIIRDTNVQTALERMAVGPTGKKGPVLSPRLAGVVPRIERKAILTSKSSTTKTGDLGETET